MAPTAPRPSTHGSSPNTTALDFPSCSFSQFLTPDLPDDATARCLHAKDVHFRRLSYPDRPQGTSKPGRQRWGMHADNRRRRRYGAGKVRQGEISAGSFRPMPILVRSASELHNLEL